MAGLLDLFVGSVQSKYAGMALLASVGLAALTLLFGREKVPFTRKIVVAVLLILLSLPTILLTLFQLTCMVTGTRGSKWCGAYAWVIAALVIVYAVMMIIVSIMSLVNGKKVVMEVDEFGEHKEYFQDDMMEDDEGEMTDEELLEDQLNMDNEDDMMMSEGFATATATPTMPEEMPEGAMPPMEPEVPLGMEDVEKEDEEETVDVSASQPETFTSFGAPFEFNLNVSDIVADASSKAKEASKKVTDILA